MYAILILMIKLFPFTLGAKFILHRGVRQTCGLCKTRIFLRACLARASKFSPLSPLNADELTSLVGHGHSKNKTKIYCHVEIQS